MSAAIEIVRAFSRLRVLVLGDAMRDTYLEGTADRICSEGPVPVVRKSGEEQVPGGAANSAANLRALGAEVLFLGVIGGDAAGVVLRAALREREVDDRWLVEDPHAATLHKLRILANDQYVVRFDAGNTARLSPAARAQLLVRLEEAFARCDLVVVSDYCYGAVSDEVLERLAALRAERPCPLIVDSKNLHRFHAAGATLITPNHLEARLTVEPGMPHADPVRIPEVERLARRLLASIDTEYVAVTLAADGVLLANRSSALHLPAHPVARPNDVGAGDSFTAAAALAIGAGAAMEDAVRIGLAAAGIAVTQRRTAVVRRQQLLQRVTRDDAPAPLQDVAARLREAQRRGRRVVFTNGVFDILHAGHVYFLREARRLGDVLVVGVNSDEGARRLKGVNRPITSAADRMALVAALDSVDHVVPFDEETPEALIRLLRPDVHVKGGDYREEDLPEAEAVREVGGEVVILPLQEGISTSAVIEKIIGLAGEEAAYGG